MALPGEGVNSAIYNNIYDVGNFLREKHGNQYIVMNLSCQYYDSYKIFGLQPDDISYSYKMELEKQVVNVDWKDHQSPFMPYLIRAVVNMHDFLSENTNNIAVVHCMAGKGRTGTLVSCFMLSTGLFSSIQQATSYYLYKRLVTVTQPDQLKYIEYFQNLMKMNLEEATSKLPVKRIKKIIFKTIPSISGGSCTPTIKIYQVLDEKKIGKSITTNDLEFLVTSIDPCKVATIDLTKMSTPYVISGDVMIKFYHTGMIKNSSMFQVVFSTLFIDDTNSLSFNKKQVGPDKVKKSSKYEDDFEIKFEFEDASPMDYQYKEYYMKMQQEYTAMFNEVEKLQKLYNSEDLE